MLLLIDFEMSSGSINPYLFTGIYDILYPEFCNSWQVFKTAWCSIFVVIIWFPKFCIAEATPLIAELSASVPPLVKTISEGLQFKTSDIFLLESSIAFLANWDNE